uniref:Putative secreted protein n=1 Tax=Anopheles darlingi TaxID=43151 RepID=A0A2M4DQY2_ANODA
MFAARVGVFLLTFLYFYPIISCFLLRIQPSVQRTITITQKEKWKKNEKPNIHFLSNMEPCWKCARGNCQREKQIEN